MKREIAIAVCVLLAACEAPAPAPQAAAGSSGALDGAAARVGADIITRDHVARVAAAQSMSPASARDLAIHDALLAQEARAQGLDAEPNVQLTEAALLARFVARDIAAAAEAQGPVTDEELDQVTLRHWIELDRPDAARVVHALVMLKKDSPPDARSAASNVAQAIRAATSKLDEGAAQAEPPRDPRGPEDPLVASFRQIANEPPHEKQEIRVEALSPVVADGRIVSEGGGRFDETFARAALQLQRRGDVSPVIETPFGYHVIVLLERIAGTTIPREERRRMVREEVMSTRARAEKEKLMASLRASVAINRDVDALLAIVPVER